MNEPWTPPEPPTGAEPLIAVDPRVDNSHVIGVLPCPRNPPPPEGWEYWRGPASRELALFASGLLRDARRYPMGAFVQVVIEGQLVAARVEWHDYQGATGRRGCFRGVNLMRVAAVSVANA